MAERIFDALDGCFVRPAAEDMARLEALAECDGTGRLPRVLELLQGREHLSSYFCLCIDAAADLEATPGLDNACVAAMNMILDRQYLGSFDSHYTPQDRALLFVQKSMHRANELDRVKQPILDLFDSRLQLNNPERIRSHAARQCCRAQVRKMQYNRAVAKWTRAVDAVFRFQVINLLAVIPAFWLNGWWARAAVWVGAANFVGSLVYSGITVLQYAKNGHVSPRFHGTLAFQFALHLGLMLVVVSSAVGVEPLIQPTGVDNS